MAEIIRPSTILPSLRTPFHVLTSDGVDPIGEVAAPVGLSRGAILCLHPLPTAGGMMDSHVFKKAANRLPAMAGITVVRFNSRVRQAMLVAVLAYLITARLRFRCASHAGLLF